MLAMSVVSVPTLLSILLVATAPGGGHGAQVAGGDETTKQHFMSATDVTAYWNSVLPNSAIPPAILHHLKSPGADENDGRQQPGGFHHNHDQSGEISVQIFDWYGWSSGVKDDGRQQPGGFHHNHDQSGETSVQIFDWYGWSSGVKDDARQQPGGFHHNHDQSGSANQCFPEDMLAPGSLVAPHIPPVAPSAPFLRREVADSIPISTYNFTDILRMFAPESLSMASEIRFLLKVCEHPILLKGEKRGCPTSIESMLELVSAVLGTHDIRAFSSSPNLPAEGVASAPQGYTVVSSRKITAGMQGETMTCHGTTFPFAVFYCHAVNPTRVYDVTLRRTKEGGAAASGMITTAPPATIRAIAVCHLDTSDFDPKNPYFAEWGLKPGEAPLCHFVGRDGIVWAPADGHVTFQ